MRGTITWWNSRAETGRVKGDDGQTYHFERAWVEPEAREHTFRRGERVAFDGDQTARRRVAYRVVPIDAPAPRQAPRTR